MRYEVQVSVAQLWLVYQVPRKAAASWLWSLVVVFILPLVHSLFLGRRDDLCLDSILAIQADS